MNEERKPEPQNEARQASAPEDQAPGKPAEAPEPQATEDTEPRTTKAPEPQATEDTEPPATEDTEPPATEDQQPQAAEDAAEEAPDPAAEIAALNDRLLRTLAEGENLRRRAQREREETAKYAIAGFARDMLSVADNLRRALDSLPEAARGDDEGVKSFAQGVELVERELMSIFERNGVEKIEPMGQKFEPNLHEAMFEMPTAEAEPGTVVQVLEVGYVLKERLLRAAKVAVARAMPAPDTTERVDTTV